MLYKGTGTGTEDIKRGLYITMLYIYIAVPVDQGEFIEHAIFAVPVLLNIQLREDCT